VGLARLELATSSLSGMRSNHLSYKPSVLCTRYREPRLPRLEPLVERFREAPSARSRRRDAAREARLPEAGALKLECSTKSGHWLSSARESACVQFLSEAAKLDRASRPPRQTRRERTAAASYGPRSARPTARRHRQGPLNREISFTASTRDTNSTPPELRQEADSTGRTRPRTATRGRDRLDSRISRSEPLGPTLPARITRRPETRTRSLEALLLSPTTRGT
jgi:hypothetical protein